MTAAELLAEDEQLEMFDPSDFGPLAPMPEPTYRCVKKPEYPNADAYSAHKYWRLEMRSGGKLAGYASISIPYNDSSTAEIEMFRIEPEFRGKGIGLRLYQRLFAYLRRNYPRVQTITGKVTSRGIAKLRQRALNTKPEYAWGGTGNRAPSKALRSLPSKSPEDADGNINGPYVYMDQPLRRRAAAVVDSLLSTTDNPFDGGGHFVGLQRGIDEH